MSFKELVSKRITKKIKFMGGDVEISKLSVAQVKEIQAAAKNINQETGDGGLELMIQVIKASVPEATDMDDSVFESIAFEELQSLSNAIMDYSGMKAEAGKDNSRNKN